MRDPYPRPDDQAHEHEHDLDPPDDADRFDEVAVFGPLADLPASIMSAELCPICRDVVMTLRERDEQHACDRCYANAYLDGLTERRKRR